MAGGCVIASGRDLLDQQDVWTCVDAETGQQRWRLAYPAPGKLDYGNSPRATPLIANQHAWLLGAFGHLHCVRLEDGQIVWKMNFSEKFQTVPLTWGLSGSPLLVDDRVVMQTGGALTSLVALNPSTGDVIWAVSGLPPGHASFATADWNGQRQLVGYDKASFGGWKTETGERLWTVVPREPGEFNVPSPIILGSGFILAGENNGTRLYKSEKEGEPGFQVAQENRALSPNSHTPVISGDRLIGIDNGLHCLSLTDGLRSVWRMKDRGFRSYGTLIATRERVLAITFKEELVLLDPHSSEPVVLSRLRLSEDGTDCWSHPALAHHALYLRLGRKIARLNLDPGHFKP